MTQTIQQILRNISDTLDPDQILSRLDMSSEELIELIQPTIVDNLVQFRDIYCEGAFSESGLDEDQ